MMTMTITRQDLEVALSGHAVLVIGPNGPEWVTDYHLYQDGETVLARRGNGTFEVLCGSEMITQILRDLPLGDGPWTIGIAMSVQEVADLWYVDAILFRGLVLSPRKHLR